MSAPRGTCAGFSTRTGTSLTCGLLRDGTSDIKSLCESLTSPSWPTSPNQRRTISLTGHYTPLVIDHTDNTLGNFDKPLLV